MKGAIIIGGHVQGLALLRSLGKKGIPLFLIDDCISFGQFSRYCTRHFRIKSKSNESELLSCLLDISKKYPETKDWLLFPTNDAEMWTVSQHYCDLSQLFRIYTQKIDKLQFLTNKKLCYKLAQELEIPIPNTINPDDEPGLYKNIRKITFPVIIKPSMRFRLFDKTSKQLFIVNNEEELKKYYSFVRRCIPREDILVQEKVECDIEDHIFVGLFFKDGEIKSRCFTKPIRQIPYGHGTGTFYSTIPEIDEITQYCKKLLNHLQYYGICNLEFLFDSNDGKYKLIDINPRTFKWISLAAYAGIDLPLILYEDIYQENTSYFNTCRSEVKLMDEFPDLFIGASRIITGKMNLFSYFKSFSGEVHYAVFSTEDIVPFIFELFAFPLIFWKRRVV